jgi:hypothetical protein
MVGTQFFYVQRPGNLVASLTLFPADVDLGEMITAVLSVQNTVNQGSTISPATATMPLKYPGSSGEVSYQTGPIPASVAVSPGNPATFTWTFTATQHTGISGTFQMIATASGIDSNVESTQPGYATSSVAAISNPIRIRYRNLEVASSPGLDFQEMVCGEAKAVGPFATRNLGSVDLTRVTWKKTHPTDAADDQIHFDQVTFLPPSGFTIAVTGSATTLVVATLTMPFNQPAGTYLATFTLFEDLPPYNGILDANEPMDEFQVRVVASLAGALAVSPAIVELGDWMIGSQVATRSLTVLSVGNQSLSQLKFKAGPGTNTFPITVTPMSFPGLGTAASVLASVSANLAGAVVGEYLTPWNVWADNLLANGLPDPGEPIATFHVRVGVGNQLMTLSPNPRHLGNGTPTFVVPDALLTIANVGQRSLEKLKVEYHDLVGATSTIPADEIYFSLPSQVAVGSMATAVVSLFVPSGQLVGTYTGIQVVYEDEDGDNTYIGDPNEAPASVTVSVYVVPYRAVKMLVPIVDAGGVAPGEAVVTGFGPKNTGNMELDRLAWEKVDLIDTAQSPAPQIPAGAYSFLPPAFFLAPPAKVFPATFSLVAPSNASAGNYLGSSAWIFHEMTPPPAPASRTVGVDPQASFLVSCQVGTKRIDVVETVLTIPLAYPYTLSTGVTMNIRNPGTLTLLRPTATSSSLVFGGYSIPATSSLFSPTVQSYLVPAGGKTMTWQVFVPAGQVAGTYIGTGTVWDDSNANSILDPWEASDTVSLQVTVVSKRVLEIVPNPLDFVYIPAGETGVRTVFVRNMGNVPVMGSPDRIEGLASQISPLVAGPTPIPAGNVSFNPSNPVTSNLGILASIPVTISIQIPSFQPGVNYRGNQGFYFDYSPQNGTWSANEEIAFVEVRFLVGRKNFAITDPIDMGVCQHGTLATKSFTLTNLTSLPLSNVTWVKGPLVSGAHSLPVSHLQFFPASGFSVGAVGPGGSQSCLASLTIPALQPPGTYIGTQTVFDDDDGNGIWNGYEASKTFLLTVTVATSAVLDVLQAGINVGNVLLGQTSASGTITYMNLGNATFSNLTWMKNQLVNATGSIIGLSRVNLPGGSLPALGPGQTAQCEVSIGPIPLTQELGVYSGWQYLSDTSLVGAYPGASDGVLLSVNVIETMVGPQLASGTIYQEVATSVFAPPPPHNRYILSALVCPGSGAARLGFLQTLPDGTVKNIDLVEIASDATLTAGGAHVQEHGLLDAIQVGSSTWYRVFVVFNYTFNETFASGTYIVLGNTSPAIASYAVWFDGIQLEKAIWPDQRRPTTFNRGKKIVSPNRQQGLSDDRGPYSEW